MNEDAAFLIFPRRRNDQVAVAETASDKGGRLIAHYSGKACAVDNDGLAAVAVCHNVSHASDTQAADFATAAARHASAALSECPDRYEAIELPFALLVFRHSQSSTEMKAPAMRAKLTASE